MVRLGREIEDRTVVSSTSLTSVIAGNLLAGLTKSRLANGSPPRPWVVANMALIKYR